MHSLEDQPVSYVPTAAELHQGLIDVFNPLVLEFTNRVNAIPLEPAPVTAEVFNHKMTLIPSTHYYFRTVEAKNMARFTQFVDAKSNQTSVGAYGIKFAASIAQAQESLTRLLMEHPQTNMIYECRSINRDHKRLLASSVFNNSNTINTLKEGIDSVGTGLTLLMAHRVPEFDNPMVLAHATVNAGLLERISLLFPFAGLATMDAYGYYYPHPALAVEAHEARVTLSPLFAQWLHKEKAAEADVLRKTTLERRIGRREGQTGRGCPAARPSMDAEGNPYKGIRLLAEAMLPYIEYFYETLPDEFPTEQPLKTDIAL